MDSTSSVYQMRRFFDFANAPLRMTYLSIVGFDVLLTKTDKHITQKEQLPSVNSAPETFSGAEFYR